MTLELDRFEGREIGQFWPFRRIEYHEMCQSWSIWGTRTACVTGTWKYLGARETRVYPSRALATQANTRNKMMRILF